MRKRDLQDLTVVCTNRSKHKRIVLVELGVWGHGAVQISPVAVLFHPSRINVTVPKTNTGNAAALNDADVWEFRCPLCTRTPRIQKSVLVAASREGMREFDVSHGPE